MTEPPAAAPPPEAPAPRNSDPPPPPSAKQALAAAAIVTVVVTAVSWLVPKSFSATAVGMVFLGATWFLTIRHEDGDARFWGVSLGGLLDRERIRWPRLLREVAASFGWAAGLAAVFYPPFYFGARYFWHPRHPFVFKLPEAESLGLAGKALLLLGFTAFQAKATLGVLDDVAGQLFVIALPEEAFFRGYLQSALEAAWPAKRRVLGAELGLGWVSSAAIFAVGHVLTAPSPARLAVFFPALLFGYLRARTRGIGAGVVFHAMCNIYSATLARGFGVAP
jgi:hypothetical protein